MADLKTQKTNQPVEEFLNTIENEKKRKDSFAILEMMRSATNEQPKMWGTSIVGFGDRHYKYESGREGDFFLIGFSPRKQNLALYGLMSALKYDDKLREGLGKYKTGKSCLYINKLEDVDRDVLKTVIETSIKNIKAKNQ